MAGSKLASAVAVGAALAALTAGGVQAQTAQRAWVSGHGTDAAGCGAPTAPCRSLQYTHDNIVAAGGEIDILDPAGYGAIAITKAIGIFNDGVGTAGVQASTGAAISVSAGASDIVSLRGLTIAGGGLGENGISVTLAKEVDVHDCVIRDFTNVGLLVNPSADADINVVDTVISDNHADGVQIAPSGSGAVYVVLKRVVAEDNLSGGLLISGDGESGGTVDVTVADSVFIGGVDLVSAQSTSGKAAVSLSIVASQLANSNTAVFALGSKAVVFLAHTTISGNVGPFTIQSGAVINSYGDNYLADNPNTGSGSLTAVSQR